MDPISSEIRNLRSRCLQCLRGKGRLDLQMDFKPWMHQDAVADGDETDAPGVLVANLVPFEVCGRVP